jgi:hypothetical protein
MDPLLGNDSVNTLPRDATRNNRTPIARQRMSKHASSFIIEAVFSARSVQSGYKEVFGSMEQHRVSCLELSGVL